MEVMGLREYARHRGCSLAAVQKAIRSRRLPETVLRREASGRIVGIVRDAADAAWARNTDPAQAAKNGKFYAPPAGPGARAQELSDLAARDWSKHSLPWLQALAALDEATLAATPMEEQALELLLHAFVTSEGAWRKIVQHVLALAVAEGQLAS